MFDYHLNRTLLLDGLASVGAELDSRNVSHAMWEIRYRIMHGPYQLGDRIAFGPDNVNWSHVDSLLQSIAVSENDYTRPSHAKKDAWHSFSVCTVPLNRVAVRWSTLLKLLVRLEVFAVEFDVNQHAEWIGSYWPKHADYEFEVTSNVHAVYEEQSLGSCMYGKEYTRWYDDNPDTVQVVRITKGGSYIGRALLWTTDGGQKYLDRVYPSNGGAHSRAVKKWAEDQGHLFKAEDNMDDEDRELSVTMNKSEHGYPYMDTFKFGLLLRDGKVQLSTNWVPRCERLNSTDGGGLDWNDECERCGLCAHHGNTYEIAVNVDGDTEMWCYDCRLDNARAITVRGSNYRFWYAHRDLVVELADGETAWVEDAVHCSHDDSYRMAHDVVFDFEGDGVPRDEAVLLANGEYAHPDNFRRHRIFLDADGEYRFVSAVLDERALGYTTLEERKVWEHINEGDTLDAAITAVFGAEEEKEVI